MQNYSIADAKNNLSRLVHKAEEGQVVHLSRRGELVAVLLSLDEFKKLSKVCSSPADALESFLKDEHFKEIDVNPAIFRGLRVKESGRDIHL